MLRDRDFSFFSPPSSLLSLRDMPGCSSSSPLFSLFCFSQKIPYTCLPPLLLLFPKIFEKECYAYMT